jgi:hypothetical protein
LRVSGYRIVGYFLATAAGDGSGPAHGEDPVIGDHRSSGQERKFPRVGVGMEAKEVVGGL